VGVEAAALVVKWCLQLLDTWQVGEAAGAINAAIGC